MSAVQHTFLTHLTMGAFGMRDEFKGPFDILIQAGQSNAEGCGLGPRSDLFYQTNGYYT